jgi:ABC-type branched-subunit amino acid transport system substrate-binding protein
MGMTPGIQVGSGWRCALAALCSSASLACSLLFNPPSARQCLVDGDCEREPALRGRTCDVEFGICVEKSAAPPAARLELDAACESTEACTRENAGAPALCRVPGTPCVPLGTPQCPLISGDWQAPNVLLLGSVGPQTQRVAQPPNIIHPAYFARLIDAMNLGVEEWQAELPRGLSFSKQPIALVHCDSAGDQRQAQQVMNQLVNVVKAPLVFALIDADLAAVTEGALASDTAVLCVGCQSRAKDSSFAQGLLWRGQPALEQQAALMAWRVSDLEQRLRRERPLANDASVRVAQFTQDSPSIVAFAERTRSSLAFNAGKSAQQNGADFVEIQTPEPATAPVNQLQIAARIAAFQPDIIVVGVDSDFTTYYLQMIEDAWPEGSPRPSYILTSLNQELGLLAPIVGSNDDLRRRISGTGLYLDDDVRSNFRGFAERFRQKYGREPENTQMGYDAFYAAAYALVVADRDRGFGGSAVVRGFGSLAAGPAIGVGPDDTRTGVTYLLAERSIDLVGTATRLDWDLTSGELTDDMGLWCLTRASDGGLVLEPNAGPRWQASSGQVAGSYGCE